MMLTGRPGPLRAERSTEFNNSRICPPDPRGYS